MPRDDDRRRRHGGGGGRGGRRDDEDDEEVEESGIQAQLPTRLQLGVLVGTGVSVCRARIFPAARALTLAACRLHSARADPGGRLYQLDMPRASPCSSRATRTNQINLAYNRKFSADGRAAAASRDSCFP